MKKFALIVLLLGVSSQAWGFEKTNIPDQFPSLGRSLRPLGMGNAYLTMKGTDSSNLYYNPAAINDYSQKLNFGVMSPSLDFSTATIGVIKDIKNLSHDLKGKGNAAQTTTFDTFFTKHVGQFHSMNLFLPVASVQQRWFAANIILDSRTTISLRNQSFPNFEILSHNDGGVAAGTAYGFLDGSLQVGIVGKFLYRAVLSEIVTITDVTGGNFGDTFAFKNWKKGFGVGADLGAKYQIPDFDTDILDLLKPTVAMTYQDVGNTHFSGGAPSTPQSISAGVGVHPDFGFIATSLDVDMREINVKEEMMKKLHVGAEGRFGKYWPVHPALRAGLNQGYPAVGAGLVTRFLSWNVAYYGEEMGNTTHQKGNYRLATSLDFNF